MRGQQILEMSEGWFAELMAGWALATGFVVTGSLVVVLARASGS
jgi:hypothetical protein